MSRKPRPPITHYKQRASSRSEITHHRDISATVAAYALGVLLVFALPKLPSLPVCTALAASALWPWRGRLLWAACVLGVLWATWHAQRALDQRLRPQRHGEIVQVQGHIASLPQRRGSGERADWRFEFAPQQADDLPPRIRATWYRSDAELRGGQCWRLQLKLRAPRGSLNPGGFDYEAWLLRSGIGATATVRAAQPCADQAADGGGGFWVLRWRQHIVERIRDVLGDTPGAALLAALSVGDTSAMRDQDWQRFRVTGTTHLIAISGFNLAIVVGFAFFVLRWAWSLWPRLCLWLPAQRVGLYGSGGVAVVYALLAGFEPPVTRALIMLLLLIAAAILHRLRDAPRALLYAWALIVTLDPFALLSPGLWLSFGAVAAILFVSLGRHRNRAAWRLALRVQLFLSLALVPLTLYFFNGFAWLSPLVNLLAVPVFSVLTPLLMSSLLLLGVFEPLGRWCLQQSGMLLDWTYVALAWVADGVPQAWWQASPPPAALILGGIGAVLLFMPRGVPMRALGVLCLAALAVPRQHAPPTLEITALDVGQGTAVVVRTAQHTLLFDAGPAFVEGFDAGASVVVPYLLARGVQRLDALVLSHDDNDHTGGVAAVRRALPVLREIGTDHGEPCAQGQHWTWDGVDFAMLHPDDGTWTGNNGSCVLHISGAFRVLLAGDIERAAEARLLREHRDALRADVLLTPHHGSATSSTTAFIEAVAPQIVIHSAGWRSHFGHPRADVVHRYAQAGAQQHITGVEGALRITADQSGTLHADGWRTRAGRWWNAVIEP